MMPLMQKTMLTNRNQLAMGYRDLKALLFLGLSFLLYNTKHGNVNGKLK